jgi:hypothetical protein
LPVSPFTPHYQRTGAIDVQPFIAPPPSEGPWSPAPKRVYDVFSSGSNKDEDPNEVQIEHRAASRVTLSQLLDNIVILEESIKELAAIAQVRGSLGIDSVRYL